MGKKPNNLKTQTSSNGQVVGCHKVKADFSALPVVGPSLIEGRWLTLLC